MSSVDINQTWARCLVSELNAHGILDAVICPGSRSAPLALAFADHPRIHTWSIIDERSATINSIERSPIHPTAPPYQPRSRFS